MSLLVYGIVFTGPRHGFAQPPPVLPLGVGNAPVWLIEASGLGAAVSRIDSPELAPSVPRALAYAGVVEALHADRTVLPLRYGCVLAGESDVVALLRTESGTYAERLRGVDGCVEMGIRVPTAGRQSSGNGDCGVKGAACRGDASGSLSGMAYLGQRQAFHAARERRADEAARAVQRLCTALAGLFLRCKTERCPAQGPRSPFPVPLLSVHFLVKREGLPSFRAAVPRIEIAEGARVLLSGPWPPYNFVTPDFQK